MPANTRKSKCKPNWPMFEHALLCSILQKWYQANKSEYTIFMVSNGIIQRKLRIECMLIWRQHVDDDDDEKERERTAK